jgi:hypothetical protein
VQFFSVNPVIETGVSGTSYQASLFNQALFGELAWDLGNGLGFSYSLGAYFDVHQAVAFSSNSLNQRFALRPCRTLNPRDLKNIGGSMKYHVTRHSQLALGSRLSGGRRQGVSAGKAGLVRQGLIGGALVASCLLPWDSAAAESPSDAEKIERLERQGELLQKQLDRQNELIRGLQQEVARARKKSEKKETELAKRSDPPVNSNEKKETELAKRSEPSVNSNEKKEAQLRTAPPFISMEEVRPAPTEQEILSGTQPAVVAQLPQFGGVRFSFWGWLEAATVFRNHNAVDDMLTVFAAIPYPFSPLYKEHEFHGTARQSQLSVLAEGDIDSAQRLAGYIEVDFLGVGTSSNYLDTNDWPPRLRQGYITYDNDNWGFHLLAGQAWSMMTPNEVGIVPRKELIPLTINANYLPGYNFTRNMQLRFVKDFDKQLWLGISLENPATSLAPGIPATVNGLAVNATNTGTGGFLNDVPVTPSVAPDIIEKVAWDPSWGHLEALAIQRFFVDNVLCVTPAPTGCAAGTASAKTTVGAGVGGNFLLPVIPKYLEVMGGVMYGNGIGRYGAGGLPDVTIAPDGSLTPLTALHAWAGIQFYPWDGLTLYGYAGIEQNQASYFGTFGYGNPASDNSGCLTPTVASFATGTSATCVADNRRLVDAKIGFWQNLYKGPMGRFVFGVELEYIKRYAFSGIGGAPSTDDAVAFSSLRYYF